MELSDDVSVPTSQEDNVTVVQETPQLAGGLFETVMAACQLILCFAIISSNSLTLVAIATSKVLRTLQKNKFIISLAVADLMVGFALLILRVQNYIYHPQWLHCQYVIAVLYSSINLSMYTLIAVALDRYVYIVHPFTHMRIVTPTRVTASIGLQWLLASMHGFTAAYAFRQEESEGCNPFNTLQRKYVNCAYPVFFFILCVVISITYGLVAKTAKEHHDRKFQSMNHVLSLLIRNSAIDNNLGMSPCVGKTHLEATRGYTRNQRKLEKCFHPEFNEHLGQIETNSLSKTVELDGKESLKEVYICLKESKACFNNKPTSQRQNQNEYSTLDVLKKQESNVKNIEVEFFAQPTALRGSAPRTSSKVVSFKWLKQMLVVFGLFVVCWTPSMACILISQIYQVDPRMISVFSMFGVANSAVNFFVYSMHTNGFRKVIRQRLLCDCRK